ncbi:MAG: DNA topoisomerase 3 [Defluviitaleaceae bacterium]|nr:DNA topoisomerase 3 [Defluviitaleaceae bacterium]
MKLIITEKPSVAKIIASVLGKSTLKDGYIDSEKFIITWCVGHLLTPYEPEEYTIDFKKWNIDTLPIIPSEFKYKSIENTKNQLSLVISLIKNKSIKEIINATDAGREGELIFRLVYNYSKSKKPVKRLWISSLEKESILDGFSKMKKGEEYDNLYKAALARQQADWIVGINATRLFSVLYGSVLNIGRVQTPTLAMVVERDFSIKNFVKEAFYNIVIKCEHEEKNFNATSKRFEKLSEAQKIFDIISKEKKVTVKSVENKNKVSKPPELYDLTTLQRESNRIFSFTAKQTLDYAQSLYEKKLITYPRTDSKYISGDMKTSISNLSQKILDFLPFIKDKNVDISHIQNIVNDKKVTDHYAILPTNKVLNQNINTLKNDEIKLLYLICTRLILSISPINKYIETNVTLLSENNEFYAKGKIITDKGYTIISEYYAESLGKKRENEPKENIIPNIKKGEILNFEPSIHQGVTTPPKHYTEDTLLLSMEKAKVNIEKDEQSIITQTSLGTPATRAGIIEKLIKTGFLERNKKQITATNNGINLVKVVPDNIKSPELTSSWESSLEDIEKAKKDFNIFLEEIKEMTKKLILNNKSPIDDYKNIFPKKFENSNIIYKKIKAKCPRCNSNILESKIVFSCENKCGFVIFKNNKFFLDKKIKLGKQLVEELINNKKVFIKNIYSKTKNKTYDANVILKDTGVYVNFELDFEN